VTISELILSAKSDGLTIKLSDSGPICSGNKAAAQKWIPALREHKTEIIAYLSGQSRNQFFVRDVISDASMDECERAHWLAIGFYEFLNCDWPTAEQWAADSILRDRELQMAGIPIMTADEIMVSIELSRKQGQGRAS